MLVNEHESLTNVLKKQKENIAKRQNNNYNNVCSQSNVPPERTPSNWKEHYRNYKDLEG